MTKTLAFKVETVSLDSLVPHPQNYRLHPDDQLEHIVKSIQEHGLYRNIVIARDSTILAGHGVVLACKKMGLTEVPVIRLDIHANSPKALKVLTGDNEIGHMAEMNDRMLTDILGDIRSNADFGLLGTGFDEMMLANLLFVTRPEDELRAIDEEAEWAGMPEYESLDTPQRVTVNFRNGDDKASFADIIGVSLGEKTRNIWWPPKEADDPGSLRFEG